MNEQLFVKAMLCVLLDLKRQMEQFEEATSLDEVHLIAKLAKGPLKKTIDEYKDMLE